MTTSKVNICNSALIKLGADTITELTEDSKNARLCNIMYDKVRGMLLRGHRWNFAIKRQVLARLTSTPAFGFAFEYQLPNDALRIVQLDSDLGMSYKIESGKLLTDIEQVNAIYIEDVVDPTRFDVVFQELFALKLAAEIAYNITGSASKQDQLVSQYRQALREARLWDGQEGIPDEWTQGTWLDER